MPARHQALAAVLLHVLLCVPPLHLGAALVLAVDRLVAAVALVLLELVGDGVRRRIARSTWHVKGKVFGGFYWVDFFGVA